MLTNALPATLETDTRLLYNLPKCAPSQSKPYCGAPFAPWTRAFESLGDAATKEAITSTRGSNHLFRYDYGIATLEVAMSAGKWTATPPRIGGNEHDEELHRQLDTIKKRSVATVWQLRCPNISYVSAKIQGRENNAVLAVSNPRRTLRGGASTLEEHTGFEAIGVLRQDIDYELVVDLIYGGMIMRSAGEKDLTHGWANAVVDLLWPLIRKD